jgi:hypothetical protein
LTLKQSIAQNCADLLFVAVKYSNQLREHSQQHPALPKLHRKLNTMCGIVGCHHVPDAKAFKPTALKMVKQCRHRGPDWSGSYTANNTGMRIEG